MLFNQFPVPVAVTVPPVVTRNGVGDAGAGAHGVKGVATRFNPNLQHKKFFAHFIIF